MRRERRSATLALGVVLAVALLLRLYGLNWDEGQWIHPDERTILMVVDGHLALPSSDQWGTLLTPQSPLNPVFHAYGAFPLYTLKTLQLAVADRLPLHILARLLSVAFDCGTVAVTYLLAAALVGPWWGVFAALLVAVSPVHVQLSHFYTVDTLLAFWTVLGAWMGVRLAATGKRHWSIGLGAAAGLAAATKLVGAALLLLLWLGWYVSVSRQHDAPSWPRRILLATRRSLTGLVAALAAFAVADPYAIIDYGSFLYEMGGQALMARGDPRFPFTLQYAGTLPYLYPFVQNLTRGWGIGVGVLAWGGLLWGVIRTIRSWRRPQPWLLLAGWCLVFFGVIGAWHTKFPRYLLPLMPLLCVLAAGMVADAFGRFRKGSLKLGLAALLLLAVAATTLYTIAIDGVYGRTHPWVSASRWLAENAPPRSRLATEYWDMALPLPVRVQGTYLDRGRYQGTELDLYPADTSEKWEELAAVLSNTHYLIVASPRVYGPVGLLRDAYPLTARFYELLFQERLGFALVHWGSNDPAVLGLRLVENPFARAGLPVPEQIQRTWQEDGALLLANADESWTVYDRPLTMIFENQGHFSAEELLTAISERSR